MTGTAMWSRMVRPDLRASLWWSADSIGAIVFAGGLGLIIARNIDTYQTVHAGMVLIVGGALWRGAAQGAARARGAIAAAAVHRRLRQDLLPRLLPSRLMRGALVGEDMHLAVDAIAATEGHIARFLPLRMAAGVSPLLIALAAAPASPVAAAIMLATLVPFVLGMIVAGGAAARRAEAQHRALARLSGLFVDRLGTLPTILLFGAEQRVARHLGEAAQAVARRTMAVLTVAFVSSAVLEFMAALAVALVAVWCGFALLGLLPFHLGRHLTLPRAFYVLALAPEFYLGLRRLAGAYHERQQGEAALAAMAQAAARMPVLPPPAPAPTRWSGRAVVVRHADGTLIGPLGWDWHGAGLHVVTGPTGGGKTSLLRALIGQIPLESGTIMADEAPFAPGSANHAIGWAGQQVALLPGTLRSNLAHGGAGDTAMRACLDQLGLGPLLDARGGLDCAIDHKGAGLSGGERRRIGLARAVLSGRAVLVLDEPTADLDAATAQAVRALLADLATRHLIVAATHDADLVALARSVTPVA